MEDPWPIFTELIELFGQRTMFERSEATASSYTDSEALTAAIPIGGELVSE